jgi:DNA modification methylase
MWSVTHGDCREVLRGIADASVDAVVCDPPYELGFMGKAWDSSGIAYDVTVWRECLRVLKPGGHLIAFGGSRTYHRLACAVEDAGFQIRDQVLWLYGNGFPKSLDVSKAIDKLDVSEAQQARRYRFTEWVRSTGLTAKQIDEATGTYMGGHYTTHSSQPAVMTRAHLDAVRHLIGPVPAWVERECEIRTIESQNMAAREVIGQSDNGQARGWADAGLAGYKAEYAITAPATDAARQWAGWGTALKPAHEPAVLARKPLVGTVAENVLAYGTSGINVDGCRVGTDGGTAGCSAGPSRGILGDGLNGACGRPVPGLGRWPANLIHDGSDETVGIFPGEEDNSAARFFYCAKASRADREFGLSDDTPEVSAEDRVGREAGSAGMDNPRAGAGRTLAGRNHHPTVKPIALMRHLVRLVTPPGGVVLDPFTGSGSTGVAAKLEYMQFIGIEQNAEYAALAQARINGTTLTPNDPPAQPTLWPNEATTPCH